MPTSRGFASIFILIPLLLITGILVGVFFVHTPKEEDQPNIFADLANKVTHKGIESKSNDPIRLGNQISHGRGCEGEGVPYKLSHLPMDPDDFTIIVPYGAMIGGHVTPIDHQYFSPRDYQSPKDAYPVYAMADSKIVSMEVHPTRVRLVFSVTCTFFYYYDLVTSVEEKINKNNLPLDVKAGELIGRIGGQTLDFAVWDTTKQLSGFVVPEHYWDEPWKIYTVDPLDYYTEDLKKLVLSRYVREAEPISGKIDHDIDGKLIGNWFLEGTVGYGGGARSMDYFKTHLSFSPDVYDPSQIVVSVGSLYGKGSGEDKMQHMADATSPNPKNIDVSSGLIKIDLVSWYYITSSGSHWDQMGQASGIKAVPNSSQPFGCALVQMLEKRKIKFEVFEGKNCANVNGFSNSALIYER